MPPFILLLEAFSLVCLLIGTLVFIRLPYNRSGPYRSGRLFLILAIAGLGGSIVLNSANYFQRKTGINLHIGADITTKASLWIRTHEKEPPDRNQTSRNLAILADGLTFLRDHRNELSPDAKTRVSDASELPGKPDHLLSIGEEGRYFRAAKDIYGLIEEMADEKKAK